MRVDVFGKKESKRLKTVREMLCKKQVFVGTCILGLKKNMGREVTGQVLDMLFSDC